MDEVWWQASPFVWEEEELVEVSLNPPEVDPIDTMMDDLLPRIRFEGEMLETDLAPSGMTEWIPGVDPVSELIEESILPPLPPAVTTLMKSYERGEETLPSGSGHVNIMVDLSGSMWSAIGNDSAGNPQTVATAAQALTRIMVNACRQGGHSFAVFAFGDSGGDQCVGPNRTRYGCSTRQIWGSTLEEAKDYDGYIANLKLNPALGWGGVGDWACMSCNDTGYAAERCYRYMEKEVGSQLPDVTAATTFFLTDAVWGDMWVAGLSDRNYYGGTPSQRQLETRSVDIDTINRVGDGNKDGEGLWYWAKKYHDDFGPFVLFKINSEGQGSEDEFKRQGDAYRKAYREYVGGIKGYETCVFQGIVTMDATGGTLATVAKEMVKFINDLGGQNDIPLCGGKGVSF